jgi:small multidrug resistance pump
MQWLIPVNPGVYWLLVAILTDVLSTFYSAKADGLVHKSDQMIALLLYLVSFSCAAIALKYMQAGILYVLWSGIGVIATALLAKAYLGQHIDLAGWLGIGFISVGLVIIAQFSNIDV